MTGNYHEDDKYEHYEKQFISSLEGKALYRREVRASRKKRKTREQIISEVADKRGLEGGFNPTYRPSKHEAGWLWQSLQEFYDQAFITDVVALVKGGKEANVYRCQAHPSTGEEFVVAKVYRPRMFRSLRNDAIYRQGRHHLESDGVEVRARDQRIIRAMKKKTDFGVRVAHTSWLMHEYTTLQRLFEVKASTPQPFATGSNAILMGYVGGRQISAPTLNTVNLDYVEAQELFQEVMHNVELMLSMNMVHGDLSAYNILYWEGKITIIDFPQVVGSHNNSSARFIFKRDVTRICEYFAKQGVTSNPEKITDALWERHVGIAPQYNRILLQGEEDYD
jgi:RIO kinase 1